MVAGLGLLSAALGSAVASCAGRISARVQALDAGTLETGAGFLLIAGFALAALALPAVA